MTHRCAWSTAGKSSRSDWLGRRQSGNRPFCPQPFSDCCQWLDMACACCWHSVQLRLMMRVKNGSGVLESAEHSISAATCWYCCWCWPAAAPPASWRQSSVSCLCWCWPWLFGLAQFSMALLVCVLASQRTDRCRRIVEESPRRLYTFLCSSPDPTGRASRRAARPTPRSSSWPCVGSTKPLSFSTRKS